MTKEEFFFAECLKRPIIATHDKCLLSTCHLKSDKALFLWLCQLVGVDERSFHVSCALQLISFEQLQCLCQCISYSISVLVVDVMLVPRMSRQLAKPSSQGAWTTFGTCFYLKCFQCVPYSISLVVLDIVFPQRCQSRSTHLLVCSG